MTTERQIRPDVLGGQDLSPHIREFKNQAEIPPGGDPYIGKCYQALVNMLGDPSNTDIQTLLSQAIRQRGDLTPTHLVNLFFRGIQYIELFERKREQYPFVLDTVEEWEDELSAIIDQNGPQLREILEKKDTTTTLYQRYAGSKIVLNSLFPYQALRVADFGCGGNYGIPGLSKGLEFREITDGTPDSYASRMLSDSTTISEGLAIDREDPSDPNAKAWRLACSFYPQELGQTADLLVLESKLSDVTNVHFLQGDVLDLEVNHRDGTLPENYFDAVIMSTFCYQLQPDQQAKAIDSARKSLNPNGVIIIQDFAVKNLENPHQLDFVNSSFTKPFSYRTFISSADTNWEMKEVLQWSNGRCREVRAGEDFEILTSSQNPSS